MFKVRDKVSGLVAKCPGTAVCVFGANHSKRRPVASVQSWWQSFPCYETHGHSPERFPIYNVYCTFGSGARFSRHEALVLRKRESALSQALSLIGFSVDRYFVWLIGTKKFWP